MQANNYNGKIISLNSASAGKHQKHHQNRLTLNDVALKSIRQQSCLHLLKCLHQDIKSSLVFAFFHEFVISQVIVR